MKTCPGCAKELETEKGACPHCGLIPGKLNPAKPQSQKKCPDCGHKVEHGALCCTRCGLIFFSKPAKPVQETPRITHSTKTASRNPLFTVLMIGAAVFLILHYLPDLRWVFKRTASTEPRSVQAGSSDFSEFDFVIDLQARPSGMTWNEKELVIGNRDAGTFMKLRATGKEYMLRQQSMGGIEPLTWNGKNLVGYKESGMFESFKKYDFTLHDGSTLNVSQHVTAPESIGGIAWDGSGYWAASRKEHKTEQGFLYRLDDQLQSVNRLVAPSPTCAGLAWDGSQLWFLDDLEWKLYVLDVDGIQAQILESYDLPLKEPAGIAFDGHSIWIADSHTGKLFRVRREITEKWIRPVLSTVASTTQKIPTNFAEYSMPKSQAKKDLHIDLFSVEVKSGVVYVSWDIRLAQRLVNSSGRPFGKITITVDGGTLSAPVVKVFDANQNRIFGERVEMLTGAESGSYTVRGLIYREYTDEEKRGRIFTYSLSPLTVRN